MNISCNFAEVNQLIFTKTGSMPSSNSNLYQVSVCCLFFGYKDNELKLLVRNADSSGKLLFPEKKLQTGHSLYETACGMAGHLLERNDYYIKQIGAGDSEMSAENEEPSLIVTYYVLTQCDNLNAENSKADDYYWISLNEANLNDEQKMLVETTLKRVRRKIGTQPVAFYLLPALFTLSQLQHLYELILNAPVDKRNFRKRVCEMNYIQQTELIDKTSSKRGAHLYSFNAELFRKSRIIFKL